MEDTTTLVLIIALIAFMKIIMFRHLFNIGPLGKEIDHIFKTSKRSCNHFQGNNFFASSAHAFFKTTARPT